MNTTLSVESIDSKAYTSDVIIYPERVDSSWWRKDRHKLKLADIYDAVASKPQILVIGTASYGVMNVPMVL